MTTIATITTKNQLTIPKEITEALSLKGVRKMLVSVKGNSLFIRPLSAKVESLAGSLAFLSSGKPANLRKVRKETQEKLAAEIVREGL